MQKETIYRMNRISDALPPIPDLCMRICGTTYPNRNYQIERPCSELTCIEYVVEGCGHVQLNNTRFSPRAGDTYLLPSGSFHHYESDRKTPWKKIWINLSGSYVNELAEHYGVANLYYFPNLDTSDILLKFQHYAKSEDAEIAAEKCMGLLSELFCRLAHSQNSERESNRSPVQAMLAYIHRHETEQIRLEQLAAACGRSPSQAERLFRAEVGIPPYRYLLNRKIELAKQLLLETGMTVRDVASYLSFEDAFYFSGLFRKKTGLSPSQFRKDAGKSH